MSGYHTSCLSGCRVLIVEDEYFLASDLAVALKDHGAEVIGPFGDLFEAMQRAANFRFDVAIIDINLRDEPAYPVADELMRRNIPFIFATGYSAEVLPERFKEVPRWEKPYDLQLLVNDVARHCRSVAVAD